MKVLFSLAISLLLASSSINSASAIQLNKKDDDENIDKNTPDRFKDNSDDIFMRSMYRTYASDLEKVDKETGEKIKTGELGVTKASAYQAGLEVLGTHKGLQGEALQAYMKENFDKSW